MHTVANLVRWDVPFAEARDPSVSLITEQGGDVATIVVSPDGVDQYPKYVVRFDKVLAMLCHEEALALDRAYRAVPDVCAYIWTDSAWLRASNRYAEFLDLRELRHYVILGSDSIVELLASGVSTVQQIDERTVIETSHQV